jgi:hypothetical protein
MEAEYYLNNYPRRGGSVFTLGFGPARRYTPGTFNPQEINVDNDGCSRHTAASTA